MKIPGVIVNLFCIFIVIIGVGKLVVQDVALSEGSDFSLIYVPGNTWLHGGNPYSAQENFAELSKLGEKPAFPGAREFSPTYYPPSAFFASLPLIVLPSWLATSVMITAFFVSFGVLIWMLSENLTGSARYLFWAFAINFGPLHSGLRPRNITLLMATMMLIPILQLARRKNVSPWWFLAVGLAAAIKPQIGLAFFALLFVARQWRGLAVALSAFGICVAGSIGWMAVNGVAWVDAYQSAVANGMANSGNLATNTNYFISNGVANFRLLNLAPLFYLVTGNEWLSAKLPVVLSAILMLALFWQVHQRRAQALTDWEFWLAAVALTGAISLLPVYTRYYGAIFLLPLFGWLWEQWKSGRLRGVLVAGFVLFSLPMPQLAYVAQSLIDRWTTGTSQAINAEVFSRHTPGFAEELVSALPNAYLLAVVCLILWRISTERRHTGNLVASDKYITA